MQNLSARDSLELSWLVSGRLGSSRALLRRRLLPLWFAHCQCFCALLNLPFSQDFDRSAALMVDRAIRTHSQSQTRSLNQSLDSRPTDCCRGPIKRLARCSPPSCPLPLPADLSLSLSLSRSLCARVSLPARSLSARALCVCCARESTRHSPRRLDRTDRSSRDPSAWLRAATRCVCRSLGWSSSWRWRGL
jgi:hypothetical protein